jgi:hypothetical protein
MDSFTGSIVHSLPICEENYEEEKDPGETGERKANQYRRQLSVYS